MRLLFFHIFTFFSDLERVREGLADKFSYAIQFTAQFFSGFAIGFWKGWKLSLVMMSLSPLLAIGAAFMSKVISIAFSRHFPANFG
jgi:ABC-type multidrug transport system fused ATPase/permease subunit